MEDRKSVHMQKHSKALFIMLPFKAPSLLEIGTVTAMKYAEHKGKYVYLTEFELIFSGPFKAKRA